VIEISESVIEAAFAARKKALYEPSLAAKIRKWNKEAAKTQSPPKKVNSRRRDANRKFDAKRPNRKRARGGSQIRLEKKRAELSKPYEVISYENGIRKVELRTPEPVKTGAEEELEVLDELKANGISIEEEVLNLPNWRAEYYHPSVSPLPRRPRDLKDLKFLLKEWWLDWWFELFSRKDEERDGGGIPKGVIVWADATREIKEWLDDRFFHRLHSDWEPWIPRHAFKDAIESAMVKVLSVPIPSQSVSVIRAEQGFRIS
jgi:hypothetical protein